VKFLSNLGALLLLNIICLSPVVACMAPEAQMSAAERACCHIMKNECGQMRMPASHGCCQKTLAGVNIVAIEKKAALLHPTAPALADSMSADLFKLQESRPRFNFNTSASPPGDFTPTLSSLRI
jgi:hypothetical protein